MGKRDIDSSTTPIRSGPAIDPDVRIEEDALAAQAPSTALAVEGGAILPAGYIPGNALEQDSGNVISDVVSRFVDALMRTVRPKNEADRLVGRMVSRRALVVLAALVVAGLGTAALSHVDKSGRGVLAAEDRYGEAWDDCRRPHWRGKGSVNAAFNSGGDSDNIRAAADRLVACLEDEGVDASALEVHCSDVEGCRLYPDGGAPPVAEASPTTD